MKKEEVLTPEIVAKEIKSRLGNPSNKEEILNKNGEILYSLIRTLKEGDMYVIGLNPGNGGEDENISNEERKRPKWKLKKELDSYIKEREEKEEYKKDGWSAYDENLPTKQANIFQENMRDFFKGLGKNQKDIFATNAIFETSASSDSSVCNYKNFLNYLPVHNWFLDIIKPKVIICIGYDVDDKSSFAFFRKVFKIKKDEIFPKNKKEYEKYRYFDVKDFTGKLVFRIYGFYHFSWSDIKYPEVCEKGVKKYPKECGEIVKKYLEKNRFKFFVK